MYAIFLVFCNSKAKYQKEQIMITIHSKLIVSVDWKELQIQVIL